MHQKIRPFIFSTEAGSREPAERKAFQRRTCPVGKVKTLMTNMESVFTKIYPGTPFQSRFFDESLEQLYIQERQTSQILNIAMGMAIFISCMGLFGFGGVQCQPADAGDRHPQSAGCECWPAGRPAFGGLYSFGGAGDGYCGAAGGLGSARMVTELRLPGVYALVDLCAGGCRGDGCCAADGEFADYSGGHG
jgi:hypothetical protein